MNLDTTTEFGSRAERRLRQELIIWLVTVRADATPQPSPVWFLWDGQTILIYSRPHTLKLSNLARHPSVALHFDGNGTGGDIVIVSGQARTVTDAPPANRVRDYLEKYRAGIAGIGMTPDSFSQAYSVAIRVTPTALRGH